MKNSTFCQRFNQIMDERHLKQMDLIRLCEPYCKKYDVIISKTNISQYRRGKCIPRSDKLYVLSRALNVEEEYLLGYDVGKEAAVNNCIFYFDCHFKNNMNFIANYLKLSENDKLRVVDFVNEMLNTVKYGK